MSDRKELKEAYRLAAKFLKKNEKKSGGPNNRNIDKQVQLLTAANGKVAENLLKAAEAHGNEERFETYFRGLKNSVAQNAARAIALLDYLERNFHSTGKPKQKEK